MTAAEKISIDLPIEIVHIVRAIVAKLCLKGRVNGQTSAACASKVSVTCGMLVLIISTKRSPSQQAEPSDAISLSQRTGRLSWIQLANSYRIFKVNSC